MEVQFTPFASSQTQQQTSQASNTTNNTTGATTDAAKTVQAKPDNVVTVAAETGGTRNERRRDTPGRVSQDQTDKAVQDLRLTNRRTQIGFDTELNRVFLEIIDTKTNEVVDEIPPEQLVRFVAEQLRTTAEPDSTDSNGNNGGVVDKSV